MPGKLVLATLALFAVGTTGATPYNPVHVGALGQGIVVPGVYQSGNADTSAVGVTNLCNALNVFWAFADTNDTVRARGRITLGQAQTYPFVLAQELAPATQDVFGTLIFVADENGDGKLNSADSHCLMAEAFHVDLADHDAAYLPTWPFNTFDIGSGQIPDLETLSPTQLTTLHSGVRDEPGADDLNGFYVRYSVGGDDSTRLVVWSAEDIAGTYAAEITHHNGSIAYLDLPLSNPHLNIVDVGTLSGLPPGFTNGVLVFAVPDDDLGNYTDTDGDGNGMGVYTVIQSPGLGAAQTIPASTLR